MVDPREEEVGSAAHHDFKGQFHAIGRGSVTGVFFVISLLDNEFKPQRMSNGNGMGRARLRAVGRHHDYTSERPDVTDQRPDTRRFNTVIVGY